MPDAFAKKVMDHSNHDTFHFSVECDICGKNIYSKLIRFSKSGTPASTEGKKKIYGLLWEKEYKSAFHKAVKEIVQYFSQCPMCKRWVCDSCFCICDEIDLCEECANDLGERGLKVSQE